MGEDVAVDNIGLVSAVNVQQQTFTVRRFFSWAQFEQLLGGEYLRNDISFWPRRSQNSPMYICDSDLTAEVAAVDVRGLAFVFYEKDLVLKQLVGMAHVYCTSSYFDSRPKMLFHCQTFSSFPSTSYHKVLSTYYPSMILQQLLLIKNKMQVALNTRALNARNTVLINIDYISKSTWIYIQGVLDLQVSHFSGIEKTSYILGDESIVEKFRSAQESFFLSLPADLVSAKRVFGESVGLGVRAFVPCRIGKKSSRRVSSSRQILKTDTINIVPFEEHSQEMVKRGIVLRYTPELNHLKIIIRFRRVSGEERILPFLRTRGAINMEEEEDEEDGDVWPMHSSTEINSSLISKIDIAAQTVSLRNGECVTFDHVIADINSRL
jgi:hypothetical protein